MKTTISSFPLSIHRSLAVLSVATLLSGAALANATPTLLFSENFATAQDGDLWNGYNSWVGTGSGTSADLVVRDGKMVGHFVNSSSTTGSLTHTFSSPIGTNTGAFRFSFEAAGTTLRGFNVGLISGTQQVGLRLGNSGSTSTHSQIGGYTRSGSSNTYYWAYNEAVDGQPAGYSNTTLYKALIDINLSSEEVNIFGSPLGAGKIRVTYNADQSDGMEAFTTIFDAPTGFGDIEGIVVSRAIATTAQYFAGNMELYAIPEPSSTAYIAGGGVLAAMLLLAGRPRSFSLRTRP